VENNFDIIIGVHSINEALLNAKRTFKKIYATEESWKDFSKNKKLPKLEVEFYGSHELQQKAESFFKQKGHVFSRVPSNIFLITNELETFEANWLYDGMVAGELMKVFCLDQVSDVHNGAAILRTAAFYGVDALLISQKGTFGFSPSFYRIASGAVEHVPVVKVTNLSKTISKLLDMGIRCIGFSEHEEGGSERSTNDGPICLVMGAEDVGISNAVSRVIKEKVALKAQGKIKSLNVSVAGAIAMEKYFNK
jgi:23S rRNA (guanosine2251-2'-O)-methyltransferase